MMGDEPIPNVIPLVGFDENDEPFIVKVPVIRKSPLPAWVAFILVVMASFTLAEGYYYNVQRARDFECNRARDHALALQIKARLDTNDRDRALLKDMIQQVMTTNDPVKGRQILTTYIERSDDLDKQGAGQRAVLEQLLKERCA
jgi:hypothetical protein